ncbi:Odorant receptor [Nesidiocoris tenuis]|uniref:Odorant receptor n=1 Tax=Nesidiocoris tenuis TaxID=355587 RepID=A0ABN7AMM2_9HEMI|nr:Odorant receptor [Nesidiocoris tenuis]
MIPFVFKRREKEDPDARKGYKKTFAICVRFSGMYPNLCGKWYKIFGVYGMYLHVMFLWYIFGFGISAGYGIAYSDKTVVILNLFFGAVLAIYYVVVHHAMYNRDKLEHLLKIVGRGFYTYERPPTPAEQKILQSVDVECKKTLIRAIVLVSVIVVLQLFLMPALYGFQGEYSTIEEGGIPINKHLSLPAWLPYNTETPTKFWLTLLLFLNDGSAELRIIGSAIIIFCNLCTCLASQFDLLTNSLRDLEARAMYVYEHEPKNGKPLSNDRCYDDPRFQAIMNHCLNENIRHYQILLEFNSVLQSYVGPAVFGILSGMALAVSAPWVLIFDIYNSSEGLTPMNAIQMFNYSSSMWSCTAFLYLYCYYGQLVTTASEKLHFALYETPWIRANTSFRRKLIITMNICEEPVHVDVLGLVSANFATFLEVVKTIFSYCNLLMATSGSLGQ